MTDDRAPLTAQEIEALRKWLHGGVEYWSGPRGNDPEWVARCTNALRALDELDEACRRLAFTEGQERRLRARLEAVEADTARLDFIERMGGAALIPVVGNVMPPRTWTCDIYPDDPFAEPSMGTGLRGAIDEAMRDAFEEPGTDMLLGDGGDDAA